MTSFHSIGIHNRTKQRRISKQNVYSLVANDKSQAEGCNFSRNVMQSSLLFVNNREQRTKNRGTCGIAVLKSTAKATVLVPYKYGTAVPR